MNTFAFFLLMGNAAQILLTGSALPVPNSPPQMAQPDVNSTQCAWIRANATIGEMPLFSHSRIFGDEATLKDVQAFKYYCTNRLITLLIDEKHIEGGTIFLRRQLDQYFGSFTTCNKYTEIKLYQYMLHQETNYTENISNPTITSIMYLLQQVGESLQTIQYTNHNNYCPDCYDQVVTINQMLEEDRNITIQDVLTALFRRKDWDDTFLYPQAFNSSQYYNYNSEKCDLYTSLYKTLVMN